MSSTLPSGRDRGQLVLLAAGVIVIALFPIVLAYFQLGYAGDIESGASVDPPESETVRALERATFDAGQPLQGATDQNRSSIRQTFVDRLDNRTDTVETARLETGVVVDIQRNVSAADTYATAGCPGGDGRDFGPCTASDGVVVQERAGDAHVIAVAVDVLVASDDNQIEGIYFFDVLTGERTSNPVGGAYR